MLKNLHIAEKTPQTVADLSKTCAIFRKQIRNHLPVFPEGTKSKKH